MHKFFIAISAVVLLSMGIGTARDGVPVGTVGEVKQGSGEVIVKSPKAAELMTLGDKLYVRAAGKVVVMRVTFSMMTIAKCALEGKYKADVGKIAKDMQVYRYYAGVEKEEVPETHKAGDVKTVGGIEFVFIPGGSFIMGSPDGVGEKSEHPRHKVTVSPFWMSSHEITQDQYRDVMGVLPSNFKGGNLPVEKVSWRDAKNFCNKYGKMNGVKTRLPAEAEWEYACRAGTDTKYYWGDTIDGSYCWYDKNSARQTHPVGRKLPNAWGLYDMSGNVWEWCEDLFGDDYYSKSPGKDPKGPVNGSYHVLRGGSWSNLDYQMRSACRSFYGSGTGTSADGFRIVIPGK